MGAVRKEAVVLSTEKLAKGIYSMWLKTEGIAAQALPGQFVILYCKDATRKLGRPISICEVDSKEDKIRLVYRVAGKGTEEFSKLKEGDRILCMAPLGNGYANPDNRRAMLVAGGIGIPPMLELAKRIPGEKTIVLGYRDNQLFLKEDFEKYGKVVIATEDGSAGVKGNVLDAIRECKLTGDVIYSCGPKPMLKALSAFAESENIEAWMSLEERMACGIGICLGCAVPIKTEDGFVYKRVCHDGPVFNSKEIIFDE